MNDSNPISSRIFQRAGSQLKEEISVDIRGIIFMDTTKEHIY